MVGIWKLTELARDEALSLLKLWVLLERADGMPADSDIVCLCMAQEGVYSLYVGKYRKGRSMPLRVIWRDAPLCGCRTATLQLARNE